MKDSLRDPESLKESFTDLEHSAGLRGESSLWTRVSSIPSRELFVWSRDTANTGRYGFVLRNQNNPITGSTSGMKR